MNAAIERCISEQAACMETVRAGGPAQDGAWLGAIDWLKEEVILRNQQVDRQGGPLKNVASVDGEIARLLHLAIIAQIQAWDAIGELETLLDSEWVAGTQEWLAIRKHISDAIQTLASDPDKSLPETLTFATGEALRETLIGCAEQSALPSDTDLIDWVIQAEPDIEKTLNDEWCVISVEEYRDPDLRAVLGAALLAERGWGNP